MARGVLPSEGDQALGEVRVEVGALTRRLRDIPRVCEVIAHEHGRHRRARLRTPRHGQRAVDETGSAAEDSDGLVRRRSVCVDRIEPAQVVHVVVHTFTVSRKLDRHDLGPTHHVVHDVADRPSFTRRRASPTGLLRRGSTPRWQARTPAPSRRRRCPIRRSSSCALPSTGRAAAACRACRSAAAAARPRSRSSAGT